MATDIQNEYSNQQQTEMQLTFRSTFHDRNGNAPSQALVQNRNNSNLQWRDRFNYSDTSANEDNSFRNRIR